jgi:hypothetical protein
MIYFGYPLDIHGWKTKPKTEPDTKPKTEPKNRGWEIIPKSEPAGPKPANFHPNPICHPYSPVPPRLALELAVDTDYAIVLDLDLLTQELRPEDTA